jgi:hypothetical protein
VLVLKKKNSSFLRVNNTEFCLFHDIPYFVYSFIHWMIFWIVSIFDYCEECCYEHICTSFVCISYT